MKSRTTKVIHADTAETLYTSTCTLDGNTVTGSINPFPYINRMLRRRGLRVVNLTTENDTLTIFAR